MNANFLWKLDEEEKSVVSYNNLKIIFFANQWLLPVLNPNYTKWTL